MQTIGTNVDGQEKNVHGNHKQEEGAKQFEIVRSFFEPEGTGKKPLFSVPNGCFLLFHNTAILNQKKMIVK